MSSGQFESLWELWDNHGFEITGLAREYVNETLTSKRHKENTGGSPAHGSLDREIDDVVCDLMSVYRLKQTTNVSQLNFPVLHAPEHDSVLLYGVKDPSNPSADPPVTEVVNAAIDLFSIAFPLQAPKVQESSVEQIATFLSSQMLQRNPGRKAALTVNVAVALLHSLQAATRETSSLPGHIDPSAGKIIQELLQVSPFSLKVERGRRTKHVPRTSSPTPTLLFGPLALRLLAGYVTAPAILSPTARSIGLSTQSSRIVTRAPAPGVLPHWDAFILRSAGWLRAIT